MKKTIINHIYVELLRYPEQLWILLQNTTGQLKQHKINAGRPTKIKIKDMEDQILYIDESGINTTDTAQYGWSRLLSCIKIRRSWQKIKHHQS